MALRAVRQSGDLVEGVFDLNRLLELERSTPDAHAAIAEILAGPVDMDVMELERGALARRMSAVAARFRSIRRHYRVQAGAGPARCRRHLPDTEPAFFSSLVNHR